MIISLKSEGLTIRTLLSCICIILIFQSCSEEESELDKSQLTLGIWYYEYKYQPNTINTNKSTILTFNGSGSYTRENEVYAPLSATGTNKVVKLGTWEFRDNNQIDLSGFGSCIQPVGEPPCTPPDVDFKIIQLTKSLLEVEELIDGVSSGRKQYTNIKS